MIQQGYGCGDVSECFEHPSITINFKNGLTIRTCQILSVTTEEDEEGNFTVDVNFVADSRKMYALFKENKNCDIELIYEALDLNNGKYNDEYRVKFYNAIITRYRRDTSDKGAFMRFENEKRV